MCNCNIRIWHVCQHGLNTTIWLTETRTFVIWTSMTELATAVSPVFEENLSLSTQKTLPAKEHKKQFRPEHSFPCASDFRIGSRTLCIILRGDALLCAWGWIPPGEITPPAYVQAVWFKQRLSQQYPELSPSKYLVGII